VDYFLELLRFRTTMPVPGYKVTGAIDSINRHVSEALKAGAVMFLASDEAKWHSDMLPETSSTTEKPKWTHRRVDPTVSAAFPLAMPDLALAGNCYATDNCTACVFHLMRAAEWGLRALVHAVGVTTPKIALEFQQWQNLIEQVESTVTNAHVERWPQPAKSNAQAFFSRVIADGYAFKDDIRNVTMHTRTGGTYDTRGALSAMNRVMEFFSRLATKVDENTQTSILDPSRFM
jgi:hypothetical protein